MKTGILLQQSRFVFDLQYIDSVTNQSPVNDFKFMFRCEYERVIVLSLGYGYFVLFACICVFVIR